LINRPSNLYPSGRSCLLNVTLSCTGPVKGKFGAPGLDVALW